MYKRDFLSLAPLLILFWKRRVYTFAPPCADFSIPMSQFRHRVSDGVVIKSIKKLGEKIQGCSLFLGQVLWLEMIDNLSLFNKPELLPGNFLNFLLAVLHSFDLLGKLLIFLA